MKFERIRLRQFKCYGTATLDLDEGVTVIHGVNGSGKTSLLEACFFALYGSKALDDRNLDDVIARGEDECEIELWFRHEGGQYRVERQLRLRDERATTTKCVLETPNGQIDGARNVGQYVTDLLRMDAEAFVNCAYVRQGEVNKLIHASPSDRQDVIDDLLQLGKLEEYRERASDARLGVKTVLDEKRGSMDDLDRRIEEKEDENLHAQLNELESELGDVRDEIDRIEEQMAEAEQTRDEATEILENHEQRREEIETLTGRIDELKETIRETEDERKTLKSALQEEREARQKRREERDELLAETELDAADPGAIEERIAAIDAEDEELRDRLETVRVEINDYEGTADADRERADELAEQAAQKRETAAELDDEIDDDEQQLQQRRERLDELDERIDEERARFDCAPIEFGESETHLAELQAKREERASERADLQGDLKAARSEVEQAETLLDEGKCPECGQPVEESPHVEGIEDERERVERLENELTELDVELDELDEKIEVADGLVDAESEVERLEDKRGDIEQLLDERAASIEDKRERVDRLREEADELDRDAEAKRESADEAAERAAELRSEIAEINGERGELRERTERLGELSDAVEAIEDHDEEIERIRQRRDELAEHNDERRELLTERRERRTELREQFDEERIEQARDDRQRAEAYLEQAKETLSEEQSTKEELQERIGGVRNAIEELEKRRAERETLAETVAELEAVYDEAEQLQTMYGTLRSELRRRNVDTLERMLNETFELVYRNDAYAHIELDDEYELTVHGKDGETLDPAQLSGGERALFNLSLRCAIYRLLAEGIEGSAPMPPLILDEPTVFLDSGHVSQLLVLIDSMRELGVEQIVVVSHDEELVSAADDLVRVEKDPATNRSTVEREGLLPAE